MFDANAFLSNPVTNPCGVISNVFRIFLAKFRTFLTLSLLQAISLIGSILLSSLISGSFFFFVFVRGGGSSAVVLPLILLILASAIAVGWVWCVYAGAMVQAAVETCAGGNPSACPIMAKSSGRARDMLGFQLLFAVLMIVGGLVMGRIVKWLGGADDDDDDDFYNDRLLESETSPWSFLKNPPMMLQDSSFSASSFSAGPGFIFLICFLYAILVFVINVSMIGAIPTIVVEGKSSCGALLRSWKLCKNSVCLIFWSVVSVNMFYGFVSSVSWVVMTTIANGHYIFLSVVMLVLYISILPISMITSVVLYLSLRVRFEGLTLSELSETLLLTQPEPSAPIATATEDDTTSLLLDDEVNDKETPLLQAEVVSEVV